ncbi:MAG TPA: PEP-CTERM sorting domain-containing protein [Cellvibrio sp.]|nr:PEP-CTERM sorting domain-containing protein [Cellvibrio sp.]
MKLISKIFAASALLAAAQANALVIDFGSPAWTPAANNQASHTVNYALTGAVTAVAGPAGSLLFANDALDGLGVTSGEIDEVDASEYLKISLANATNIVSIKLTDLFPRNHPSDGLPTDGNHPAFGEVANISFYLGGSLISSAVVKGLNSVGVNGEQLFFTGGVYADEIKFVAGGPFNEYSVKSIEVPEPGIFALLGLGLMGLGLSRRRQAKQA